jgi:hypothetical protein
MAAIFAVTRTRGGRSPWSMRCPARQAHGEHRALPVSLVTVTSPLILRASLRDSAGSSSVSNAFLNIRQSA